MAAFIIIICSFLFFYWMLKIGGLLDKKPTTKKEEGRFKGNPTYSSKTIRDTLKPKQKEIIVQTLDLPDDEKNGVYESKISGITLRCTEADKGIFHGIIYNEEDNPYNNNAMAIVSMNKKLLGYIPDNEINKYWNWSNGLPVTCVGFIKSFVNDEGNKILYGRVYAIKPCNTKFVKSKVCELDEEIERSHFLSFSRV